MNPQDENWFSRNKEAILGIAVAVLVLNIVLFLFVPTNYPVSVDVETFAYDAHDASFQEQHTLTLTGIRSAYVLKPDLFSGEISLDGASPVRLELTRENGRWVGTLPEHSPVSAFYAARDFQKLVLVLSENDNHFLAPEARNARAAQVMLDSYLSE